MRVDLIYSSSFVTFHSALTAVTACLLLEMEAASILTNLVRSGSHLESKTGEKEAREADFSIRE
jgi:hypothetical protein